MPFCLRMICWIKVASDTAAEFYGHVCRKSSFFQRIVQYCISWFYTSTKIIQVGRHPRIDPLHISFDLIHFPLRPPVIRFSTRILAVITFISDKHFGPGWHMPEGCRGIKLEAERGKLRTLSYPPSVDFNPRVHYDWTMAAVQDWLVLMAAVLRRALCRPTERPLQENAVVKYRLMLFAYEFQHLALNGA
jgi:hypothetical protein